MGIIYRTGRVEDCPRLAEFVDIASDGVVEFLFHDLIPHQTPVQIMAHNLEMEPHELIPHEGGAYLMKCPIK